MCIRSLTIFRGATVSLNYTNAMIDQYKKEKLEELEYPQNMSTNYELNKKWDRFDSLYYKIKQIRRTQRILCPQCGYMIPNTNGLFCEHNNCYGCCKENHSDEMDEEEKLSDDIPCLKPEFAKLIEDLL